jgi:hypothetical protein
MEWPWLRVVFYLLHFTKGDSLLLVCLMTVLGVPRS